MKPSNLLLFVYLAAQSMWVAAQPVPEFYVGADTIENAPCEWSDAQWLAGGSVDSPRLLRKSFSIGAIPENARLHVYGGLWHRIYLNGRFVGDTSRRGYPLRYRSFLISDFLQSGENVLAIESADGSVIAKLEADGEKIVATDTSWKYAAGTAFLSSGWNVTKINSEEVFDARLEPEGWREPGFDDSAWRAASSGSSPESRWNLAPDVHPPVNRSFAAPASIVQVAESVVFDDTDAPERMSMKLGYEPHVEPELTELENIDGLLDPAQGPVLIHSRGSTSGAREDSFDGSTVPTARDATIIVDFGRLINGNFFLDIEGAGGEIVDIGFGQFMLGDRVPNLLYGHGTYNRFGNCAGRYILKPGRQIWQAFYWESVRFAQITVRRVDPDAPVKIHAFGLIDRDPVLPLRGSFACSDPLITEIWATSERTTRLTTQDVYMDNISREKIPWGGECASRSIMTSLVAYGENNLNRNNIRQFTDVENGREVNSTVQPVQRFYHFFHPMQLHYALTKYRYFAVPASYTQDQVLPALRAYVQYIIDQGWYADGIVEADVKSFLDWNMGGGSTAKSLFYLLLVQNLAKFEREEGNTEAAATYQARADLIMNTLEATRWNESEGYYTLKEAEHWSKRTFSEHINALALLAGLGESNGRADRILEGLVNQETSQVDAMTHFLAEACFKRGRADLALKFIRRLQIQTEYHPKATFWECRSFLVNGHDWTTPHARSHAQSAGSVACYVLSTELLGVMPTKPGFEEFEVYPKPGGLEWAEGVMPSPKGDIPVRWEFSGGDFVVNVTVPEATSAKLYLLKGSSYELNESPYDGGVEDGSRYRVDLSPGTYVLKSINPN